MMDKGLFRKDLYFRLGVIKIEVPSLNERPEDILPLAKHYLDQFNTKFGTHYTGLSAEAEQALCSHHWTGNVRELKNMVERSVLIGRNPELSALDLGLAPQTDAALPGPGDWRQCLPPIPAEGVDLTRILEAIERRFFTEALSRSQGNESQAARLLGLNHHTFRYRHKKLLK
jgi:DNA-binding NtrC family response regulator